MATARYDCTVETAAPHALSYDDLSPGSDIRREFAEGVVRISVPAGPLPPQVLKQARYDALIESAFLSSVFLLAGASVLIIAIRARPLSDVEVALAWGAFAILCTAFVLLVASARYASARDALLASRRQSTAIAVTPARLIIESAGPFGAASHDIPADQIAVIRLAATRWHDQQRRAFSLRHVRVVLKDGRVIDFVPGRDRDELRFIMRAIGSVTNGPARLK